jgi:hypothetical protein
LAAPGIRTPVTEVGDRSSASLPLARMTHLLPTSGVRTAVVAEVRTSRRLS